MEGGVAQSAPDQITPFGALSKRLSSCRINGRHGVVGLPDEKARRLHGTEWIPHERVQSLLSRNSHTDIRGQHNENAI